MARAYRLKRRAERQDETRQRIVEAAVALHTTLGPTRTSIAAIAERAGVERPTVYRHFPTVDELLTACSTHYRINNPPPDPEPWLQLREPEARLRRALGEIYGHYAARENELWVIFRDLEDMPELRHVAEQDIRHHARILDIVANAWPDPRDKRLRAALGHATDFFAWRSLRRQGLSNDEAAEQMAGYVMNVR